MALALLPLGAALWLGLGEQQWWPLAALLTMSLLTVAAYAWDKRQAVRGEWRIPESRLHLLELCGGWPGGTDSPPVAASQDPEAQLPAGLLVYRAAAPHPVGALGRSATLAAIAVCITKGQWAPLRPIGGYEKTEQISSAFSPSIDDKES